MTNEVQVMDPERAQVDVQVSTAHRYPRDIARVNKAILDMATIDTATAAACFYARPVGMDPDTGKQKIAEGLSVRFAEIVAALYGNLRTQAQVIEQTDRQIRVAGMCWDIETNNAIKVEVVVSTVKRNGQPYSEGQRAVMLDAAMAKALRNAIFKVVPKAALTSVIAKIKAMASSKQGDVTTRKEKVKKWLTKCKIEDARVFTVLDVQSWDDVTVDHLDTLHGIYNAITDGETSYEEAFPVVNKGPSVELFKQPPKEENGLTQNQKALADGMDQKQISFETIQTWVKNLFGREVNDVAELTEQECLELLKPATFKKIIQNKTGSLL